MKKFHYTNKRGFTLIELLVVIAILGLLATVSFISYRSISQSGRDSTRKAQLEQIRSAIEQFRSNNINGSYPDLAELTISCSSSGAITDGTNTYLSKIPLDPSCSSYSFYYKTTTASGDVCDSSSATIPCLDYTLGSYLENASTSQDCTAALECVGNCRYCLGPYGAK